MNLPSKLTNTFYRRRTHTETQTPGTPAGTLDTRNSAPTRFRTGALRWCPTGFISTLPRAAMASLTRRNSGTALTSPSPRVSCRVKVSTEGGLNSLSGIMAVVLSYRPYHGPSQPLQSEDGARRGFSDRAEPEGGREGGSVNYDDSKKKSINDACHYTV